MSEKKNTLEEARSLNRAVGRNMYQLGLVLMRINAQGYFLPKYPNMVDYAWGALGMKRGTCYALIKTARTMVELGIPDSAVEDIGWSKFHLLCPHLDEDNWRELTQLARHASARELQSRLRGHDDTTLKRFRFDQDDLATLDRAIGTAKALTGAGTESEAIVALAEVYLTVV